jgi:prolyl oligopeptidase
MRNPGPFEAITVTLILSAFACVHPVAQARPTRIPAVFSGTISGAAPLFSSTVSLTAKDPAAPVPRNIRSTPLLLRDVPINLALSEETTFAKDFPMRRTPEKIAPTDDADTPKDNYLWLENNDADETLAWVREHNAVIAHEFEASPVFETLRTALLDNADALEKWPNISRHDDFDYNFCQTRAHARGIWRRTQHSGFISDDPAWEIILDLDALAAHEKENWTWGGAIMGPAGTDRALVQLSRGGADARVIREFDLKTKTFIPAENGGFVLPEALTRVSWRTVDALFVATDFGPDSLNQNGTSRILKEWKRGTPLSDAQKIFEGEKSRGGVYVRQEGGGIFIINLTGETTSTGLACILRDEIPKALAIPPGSQFACFKKQIILRLPMDWTTWSVKQNRLITYPKNSVIAGSMDAFLAGKCEFTELLRADANNPLPGCFFTRNHCIISLLDNIRRRYHAFRFDEDDGLWTAVAVDAPVSSGRVDAIAEDAGATDDILVAMQDYLVPPKHMRVTVGKPGCEIIKQMSALFDTTGMEAHRHEAISRDGTRIPYFLVTPKNFRADGSTPAILEGYGAYGHFKLPEYLPDLGKCWLERGGVHVYACVRGGGEFGVAWREGGHGKNRQNTFDDFAAVAQDLIERKITSPEHLGIRGISSGGLLVAVSFTQHPELFRAAACESPLLDMRRYVTMTKGSGTANIPEYGDPGRQQSWDILKKFSPYQNVKPTVEAKYPRVLFTTSSNDNRVHPGHTRKMAALMEALGHDILFFEETDGGHGNTGNIIRRIYHDALVYTFFSKELGLDSRN